MSPAFDNDTIAQVASDLRDLRMGAGNPTLEALAHRTGVSKTVLSDAFAGKRLPSERTVTAVVGLFGGDVASFAARRAALEANVRLPEALAAMAAGAPSGDAAAPERARRTVSAVAATWLAVAAAVVGAAVGGWGVHLAAGPAGAAAAAADQSQAPAVSAEARIAVTTGQDPALTDCVSDAAVAAAETRANDTLLEIVWSDACQAGWARITRYDGKAAGNLVSASIFRQTGPEADDRQDTTEPDAQSAYTTLLVRPTPDTRVCAVGEITVDGEHISLGDPMCL
ncbi:DUF2690 domain-containing protein [Xylanimonas ulmi]|uniref:Uncharacterized protein DUF2690 n=1 Tax=Xylanimonas ulmi TaxID=228973 RepID=A0A4Q7M1W6_9MICO|nr:DUF2690 domain-containing protein [Xylanibacterium ulmi]RZS60398.1 uncharacterized protein DUF2690 [Xylanibacterium ulmi]